MVISTESSAKISGLLSDPAELRVQVEVIVNSAPIVDVHTHLFPPEFNGLCLFGIDELLTYHYLTAETFRSAKLSPEQFWKLSKTDQADLVWQTLFVENSPTSEAARGIVSVLDAFGLDTRAANLAEARAFFNSRSLPEHVDRVFAIAQVSGVVMTNDPLDEAESKLWRDGISFDSRFKSALRLDGLLNDWEEARRRLSRHGVSVDQDLESQTITTLRRLLDQWIERLNPVYMAVSFPADFKFPADDVRDRLLREVIVPTAKEHNLALTLMVGVRRGVNPELREAVMAWDEPM